MSHVEYGACLWLPGLPQMPVRFAHSSDLACLDGSYADAKHKVNYRMALADLLREQDKVGKEIETSRSEANG